jgi:class 3 adenylate cyclase/predicted ATPase
VDVGGWLRGLGLGQYAEQFRDNKIDADLLPRLTVDDLKDIGVSVVGDRRRLLDAIAVIASAGPPADIPASAMKSAPSKGLQASAERRPITVMFCDLVDSTSLAAKLDAEDWRNLVNAYLDEASAAVTGFGGHVLKRLGDGLMALFGYPHAQENDAERAVRAALAIQRALVEINARNASKGAPELAARIGLDSGQSVVDATGEVFGDAPNIAARVQSAAEPGSILITATVQRQTAGLFVAEDRGQHELKGVSAPMTLYRVVRASGGGRRGGARLLTPLVGREEELDLLARRWERAHKGEGQLALIVGEPGLGKSRLMEEFHGRLGETPHTWTEWSSSQLLQNTPLHPIAEWGRQRFGADLAPEQRLADLEHTLQLVGLDPTEYAPLLAPLVNVLLPEDRVAKLAPEALRRRQLAAMTAWILASAKTQAVVLAFEDLHWADPTSLDLMRALAERGAQAPLLIIATARPEFRPPWSVRSHHSAISLSPLDRVQIANMVAELAAHHTLPRDIVEGVSERTGGVPLFVEEVTRLLLERGEQGGAQAIPPTLQQSLAARLDRLGSARETAQIGAVLGRGFSYALLQSVAGLDEGALQSALERLAEADILFVEGDGAQATYRFKHALIQNAAYDSLLKSRRQALHARAAEILRESASPEAEAVAHHFTEAGLNDLAIEWWGKAGDQALRRSAFQEAIAHLGKAIDMADMAAVTGRRAVGAPVAPTQHLTQLHVAYGNALIAARGYSAPETAEAFARARESASGDADAPGRLAADYGLWASSYMRGDLPSMRAHAEAFLSDLEARPDSPEASVAHRAAGMTCWFAGGYREARGHLERALALFEPGRDDDLTFRFAWDPGVAAMASLAIVSWSLGEVDRAISLIDRMQTRIAGLTHVGTLAVGRMHAAMFELMRGDHLRAAQNAFELARLAREHDLNLWRAFGVFLQGWAASQSGALADGLEDMRRGAALLREQNALLYDGLLKVVLAGAEAGAGDLDRAVAVLDEALATCDRTGYRAFEAELHRARGEILLKRDPANPAAAEEAFLTALAVTKQQGTRSFELRAALSLARLHQSTDRPVEAHDILAPALKGFSPTPEMPEIGEAQALLAALEETDEVKFAADSRRRRAQLQASYSKALAWSRGFAAEETMAAAASARRLAAEVKDPAARFAVYRAQCLSRFMSGQIGSARLTAETYLAEAKIAGAFPDIASSSCMVAHARMYQGGFADARKYLDEGLETYVRRLDSGRSRNGWTYGTAILALVSWQSGEVERARELIEQAMKRANTPGSALALSTVYSFKSILETLRQDAEASLRDAEMLGEISKRIGLPLYSSQASIHRGWAHARLGDREAGLDEFRKSLADFIEQKTLAGVPYYQGLLADLEADGQGVAAPSARIDEALALAEQTDQHWTDAFLHRIRGDILLKANPEDFARAEDAYLAAIAVAREQGARSFGLQAALRLAKLYRSTDRPADADAVLAPALEGFTPTPEMPEIAEAQALLVAIEAGAHVRHE